jgi:hypothetical protein
MVQRYGEIPCPTIPFIRHLDSQKFGISEIFTLPKRPSPQKRAESTVDRDEFQVEGVQPEDLPT